MLGVDSDTVVLVLATLTDEVPATLLLLEVETSGVGQPNVCEEDTEETEPRHNVEALLDSDVVVEDGGEKCTTLARRGGETVSSGTDSGGVDLGGDDEGDTVRAELGEERRQEVHGLELVRSLLSVVVVVESRNDEAEEVSKETDDHHPLATVELVVDHERSKVVSDESDEAVEQIPQPGDHDGLVVGVNGHDELRLEQLGTVEEDIGGKPGTSSSKDTSTEV